MSKNKKNVISKSYILSYNEKLQILEDWKTVKDNYLTLAIKYGISYWTAKSICKNYGIKVLNKQRNYFIILYKFFKFLVIWMAKMILYIPSIFLGIILLIIIGLLGGVSSKDDDDQFWLFKWPWLDYIRKNKKRISHPKVTVIYI